MTETEINGRGIDFGMLCELLKANAIPTVSLNLHCDEIEVNEKQNYNPFVYGDGTLAKIDFIKENDLHIFIFTWSCLEFKLYINSKSKLNPPSTDIDFCVRIG